MSDQSSDNKNSATGDPEGEWDTVVRRISDRIKKKPGSSPTSTPSSLDMADELARLESRALTAEQTLASERDAYAIRVREMEDKLRKLEPWLRQLKGEYQKAAAERDRLREEMSRSHDAAASATGAVDAAKIATLLSEREAALREAEAAGAARDVAVAEAESLKKRMESERSNVNYSWQERISTAEKARDQALDDLKQMRKAAGENRRTEEEVKRLLKQCEQLETTTSAHKAVARAAQEEVEALKTRVVDLEKSGQKKAETVQQEGQRAQELSRQMSTAKAELAATQMKLTDAESAIATLRGEHDKTRKDLAEKAQALEAARHETSDAKKTLEKLRAETTDAKRSTEAAKNEISQAKNETAQARRESEAAVEEAGKSKAALEVAKNAGQKARDEAAAAKREAADAKELLDEAMRSEEQARRRTEEVVEKLTSAEQALGNTSLKVRELDSRAQELTDRLAGEQRTREEAERRIKELDAKVEQSDVEIPELRAQVESAKGRVRVLEGESANLTRTIEDERQSAAKRFETAETSWRSQMRAAEGRFEADVHKERERAREVEELLRVSEERHVRAVAAHDLELTRLRGSVAQYVADKALELVAAVQQLCASTGEPPVELAPMSVAIEGLMDVTRPHDVLAATQPQGPADWDKLISDVEQLWTEVEGMRTDAPAMDPESDPDLNIVIDNPKPAAPPVTVLDEPVFDTPVSDGNTAEVEDTHTASQAAEQEVNNGRQRRRRRR